MSDEDYQERDERESRRRREIKEFCAQQRISREWIPVHEIVEWCAASVSGAVAEEAERLAASRLIG